MRIYFIWISFLSLDVLLINKYWDCILLRNVNLGSSLKKEKKMKYVASSQKKYEDVFPYVHMEHCNGVVCHPTGGFSEFSAAWKIDLKFPEFWM